MIPILFKIQDRFKSSSPDDIRPQAKHVEPYNALSISLFPLHASLRLSPIWAIALGIIVNTIYKTEFLIVELYVSPHLMLGQEKIASIERNSDISG